MAANGSAPGLREVADRGPRADVDARPATPPCRSREPRRQDDASPRAVAAAAAARDNDGDGDGDGGGSDSGWSSAEDDPPLAYASTNASSIPASLTACVFCSDTVVPMLTKDLPR